MPVAATAAPTVAVFLMKSRRDSPANEVCSFFITILSLVNVQGLWASLTNGGRRSNFFPVQCMVTLIHIYRRFFRACSRASLLLNHLTFLPSFSSPEGATG